MPLTDADRQEEVCAGCKKTGKKYANCIDCAVANAPSEPAISVAWVNALMLEGDEEDSKAAWRVLRRWKEETKRG